MIQCICSFVNSPKDPLRNFFHSYFSRLTKKFSKQRVLCFSLLANETTLSSCFCDSHNCSIGTPVFQPFPVGTIKPQGWLLDQLNIQANGFSLRVDEIWPDVCMKN